MKKGPGIAYDKWNISVVICDTNIPSGQPSHGDDRKTLPRGTLLSVRDNFYTVRGNLHTIRDGRRRCGAP